MISDHAWTIQKSYFKGPKEDQAREYYDQFSSVAQSCLTLCDPMGCSTPGFPVHHELPEFTQTHVHRVGDAIQTSHPLLSPSLSVFNLSQLRVFPSESALPIWWPKYWSFTLSISSSKEYSVWISFRITALISMESTGLSRAFCSTAIRKIQIFGTQPSLWSNSHIHTWLMENQRFDHTDLCWQSDASAFSTLFRFVIAFVPRSKYLLISQLQSPSMVILEPKKIVCHCFHFSPFIFPEVMGRDAVILAFWMLSFKPAFSVSYFTLIKKLFSSSSISAIIVVSSTYLRLLIFLPVILLPACTSSSLAFCIMYSAYKLNKQGDNTQLYCTSFTILNQSVIQCNVLTVAFWPTYRFLRRQISWSDIPISLRIFHSLF